MKLTKAEMRLGRSSQQMAGFLVIKMLDARATGNTALATEIEGVLKEAKVDLTVLPSGAVSFMVAESHAKGAVFPPPPKPPKPEEDLTVRFAKLERVCDFMAVHYHSLFQNCTVLLARLGASGPPYAKQVAVYRELRRSEIKAIEDLVKPAPAEHKPSQVIMPEPAPLVGPDGKKVH